MQKITNSKLEMVKERGEKSNPYDWRVSLIYELKYALVSPWTLALVAGLGVLPVCSPSKSQAPKNQPFNGSTMPLHKLI
jgi:hypothetical protein